MRKLVRISLVSAGFLVVLLVSLLVYFSLLANNIITFTKKTQSIELPKGGVLNIYCTSTWEYYNCKFELRDRTGTITIPNSHFYLTTYWSSKSAAGESTPDARTKFLPLLGAKSGIIGLASSEDPDIILVVVDVLHSKHVATGTVAMTSADRLLGETLLSQLKQDYPDRKLALEQTEAAVDLRRQRSGVQNAP